MNDMHFYVDIMIPIEHFLAGQHKMMDTSISASERIWADLRWSARE